MQGNKRGELSRKQQARLPAIAPKDDHSSPAIAQRNVTAGTANVAVPPRSRLPPRSRTGCCWQRCMGWSVLITHQFQTFVDLGSANSPTSANLTPFSNLKDIMPPFASLETDEEREEKARSQNPGTYHVVVNPESFSHLPEYSEDSGESSMPRSPEMRRDSIALSTVSSTGYGAITETGSTFLVEDENTVIVRRFDDTSRRGTLTSRDVKAFESLMAARPQPQTESPSIKMEHVEVAPGDFSLENIAAGGDGNSTLLSRFRSHVVQQVVQFQNEQNTSSAQRVGMPGAEIFEEGATFSTPVRQKS
ncbi:MAG: hypothetical protein Q9160_008266 [Pyrenula sp. 1 TL-2023]